MEGRGWVCSHLPSVGTTLNKTGACSRGLIGPQALLGGPSLTCSRLEVVLSTSIIHLFTYVFSKHFQS